MLIRIGGLFSGIGAHHSAVERVRSMFPDIDFKIVFQCEYDQKTARAYDVMHGTTLNLGDITQVNDIGGALAVDVLFWTPPCQDISNAGQRKGNAPGSGTRSALAFEVPRILANTPTDERPKYLVFEEVPAMLSDKFMGNFQALLKSLSDLGYYHEYGVMNGIDYGVAQTRKRCFMISKLGAPAPQLPRPRPLDKCLKDYLECEPVAPRYYLSENRLKGLIWSNEKEKQAKRGFKFQPTNGDGPGHTITTKEGHVKTSNYLLVGAPE